MGRLEHPNIPPVHKVELDPPCVIMKLIEGQTLSGLLAEVPQRKEALYRALDILIHVSYALEYAHEQGILHRDIKPENIMVGRFNSVYLMDWGLAFELEERKNEPMRLAGTPAYMAPEMLLHNYNHLGQHTDIYLMAAVLHEILTGQPRHQGSSLEEVLQKVNESQPYDFDESVPLELSELCNKSCTREPTQRPKSIVVFREALQTFLSHVNALSFAQAGEPPLPYDP